MITNGSNMSVGQCPAGLIYSPMGTFAPPSPDKTYFQVEPYCWALINKETVTTVKSTEDKLKEFIPTDNEQQAMDGINALRKQLGLSQLTLNKRLALAARQHAEYIRTSGDASHVGGNPAGRTPRDRVNKVGYRAGTIGENLAAYRQGYSPTAILYAWYYSPSHKEAMIDPRWRVMGIGDSGVAWVVLFGDT